jgi:hypothetical protein
MSQERLPGRHNQVNAVILARTLAISRPHAVPDKAVVTSFYTTKNGQLYRILPNGNLEPILGVK